MYHRRPQFQAYVAVNIPTKYGQTSGTNVPTSTALTSPRSRLPAPSMEHLGFEKTVGLFQGGGAHGAWIEHIGGATSGNQFLAFSLTDHPCFFGGFRG